MEVFTGNLDGVANILEEHLMKNNVVDTYTEILTYHILVQKEGIAPDTNVPFFYARNLIKYAESDFRALISCCYDLLLRNTATKRAE